MCLAFYLSHESEVVLLCIELPPQNFFLVDQVAPPWKIFFFEISPLHRPSVAS